MVRAVIITSTGPPSSVHEASMHVSDNRANVQILSFTQDPAVQNTHKNCRYLLLVIFRDLKQLRCVKQSLN